MDNRPIGILDSGFGGLSILKSIKELIPKEGAIYFGDNFYAPYGEKDSEVIKERVLKILAFFVSKNVKLVVVACNTATVVGIDFYRSRFPDLPIVGVVPVVKKAAELSKNKKFAILATAKTIKSDYQKNLINKFALGFEIKQVAADTLVKEIEEGKVDEAKEGLIQIVEKENLKQYNTLVLGCTHFVFLKDALDKNLQVLDSSVAVANQVKRILEKNGSLGQGRSENYYTSGDAEKFRKSAEKLLKKRIEKVERVTI